MCRIGLSMRFADDRLKPPAGTHIHIENRVLDNIDDVQLYVNGVRETGAVAAGSINTKALASMRIGTDEAGKYFTGLMDDVRVYDRALTAEEIAAIAGE